MPSDPLISRTIGNYTIISRLGKGGMATVYRARQINMGRDVALKIMSDELAEDPQFIARFEREAQFIAQLEHPRILPVHDFGHDGEIFYLVMRLIEGESLYEHLQEGSLPLATVARFVNQIAEALDYAHSQGVIHRDLKPNNILIDQWNNLYLMDFGLAKLLAASTHLTQSGAVLGTPAYMAPEQWRGEPVDARTDVYALGVILYEMVLGRTPFESDTPFTLMYKHINDAPPPPQDIQPDLPAGIQDVILKALAKNREDRYQSAGDLARAFTAAVQAAGVTGADALIAPPVVTVTCVPASEVVEAAPIPAAVPVPAAPEVSTPSEAAQAAPEAAGGPEGDEVEVTPSVWEALIAADAAAVEPPAAGEESAPEAEPPVPPPPRIAPPPGVESIPPIPVPGAPVMDAPITGAPDRPRPMQVPRPGSDPGRALSSPALRQALEAVGHSLEVALERAAEAAPPVEGSGEIVPLDHRAGSPAAAPAYQQVRNLLPAEEPLTGVLDVRGTPDWATWKTLLIAGIVLNVLGGMLSVGLFSVLGWLAWIYVVVQGIRTWKGQIGRYYLGFTPQRVLMLPRSSEGRPQFDQASSADWAVITRLRLSSRYVLLDMPTREGRVAKFAALVVPQGEGGLGNQYRALPGSPITALVREKGFELRNLE